MTSLEGTSGDLGKQTQTMIEGADVARWGRLQIQAAATDVIIQQAHSSLSVRHVARQE